MKGHRTEEGRRELCYHDLGDFGVGFDQGLLEELMHIVSEFVVLKQVARVRSPYVLLGVGQPMAANWH